MAGNGLFNDGTGVSGVRVEFLSFDGKIDGLTSQINGCTGTIGMVINERVGSASIDF